MRLLFSLFLTGLAIAAPSPRSTHVLHERRAALSPEWVQSRRLDSDLILPMKFGLTQQNMHRLEELLLEISHPESPKYSQHYTPEQVMETFAPSAESIDEVMNWLTDSGIARERIRLSGNKSWIHLNATVTEAEELLQTEYHVFSHSSGEETLGCHHYSVPAHVKEHIDIIRPTVHSNQRLPSSHRLERRTGGLGKPSIFNGPKRASSQAVRITPNLENCDQFITPDCLRALYDIKHKPIATNKNSYGIVEFTPQAFLAGDLDLFFRNFSPSLVGVRPKAVLIDGAVVQTANQSFDFNGESDLDLQYSMSLSAPQPITLLQTGDLVEGAGFDNWLDAVDASFCTFEGGDDPNQDGIYPDPLAGGFKGPESCGIVAPPHTVSVSFLQDEQTVTPAFANRQCAEYAKLGLMGTTVFHSSGDFGVAGNGGICLDANHNPVDPSVGPGGTVFNPGFPASCPFVTAVGATQINPGNTVNDPEGACEQVIFSGGGFSNIFPMPSYQANAVRSFLKNHPPPFTNGQFNNSGNARGFPDVAANGANYVIGIDGAFNLVFGTSASSPVVGSIITLVNDARLAIGKKPVGFLNPLLYSPLFRGAFNDITSGGNQGCGTPGFTATTGWDPVTGVGTPNLTKLIELALVLP